MLKPDLICQADCINGMKRMFIQSYLFTGCLVMPGLSGLKGSGRFGNPVMQSSCHLIVESGGYVSCKRALLPGEVLRTIIPSIHGNATFHRTDQRTQIAADTVFFDD